MTNCVVLRSTEMPVKARVKGVWGAGLLLGRKRDVKMWSDRRVIKSMSRNNKNCHFRLVLKFGPSGRRRRRRRRQREWGRIRNLAVTAAAAVVAHINQSKVINQSVVNTQQKRRRRTHSTDDDAAAVAIAAAACR